ncbi:MAG: septal ring lytic transglycosylase RlpA family protein [Candidatus Accumulibacter sp.]|jgi:rare lipoprotein A|nr:septal ring lytic transglycosylase RlpA family protein [Accumulibacter sp.]
MFTNFLKPLSATLIAIVVLSACQHAPGPRKSNEGAVKRGGGYYKDDGPGNDIPDDIDTIPDALPRAEPLHRGANKPYVVFGKTYVPDTRLRPFRQRGTASWYGKKFHGRKTSIGESYDMFAMTAAHPTLALPSYARVTNIANGKSVVVRLIDRGPFHASRIIDMSYAAAYRLGYIGAGSAQVEVESVLPGNSAPIPASPARPPAPVIREADAPSHATQTPLGADPPEKYDAIEVLIAQSDEALSVGAPETLPPVTTKGGVFLQLGAFSSADNAENFRIRLAQELDWLTEKFRVVAGETVHRVQVGPYPDREAAEKVAQKIKESVGYSPSFVDEAP